MNPVDPAPADPGKPSLVLLPGDAIAADAVLDLFRHLTGREPTAEEAEQLRREWVAGADPDGEAK